MIFYFTGTGNSFHVAKALSEATKEKLISISEAMKQEQFRYEVKPEERVGFVFPVYYWGLPTIVEDFIKKLQLDSIDEQFVYSVVTCGANIGTTMNRLKSLLEDKDISLDSGYSITYVDNYVILYDLSDPAERKQELQAGNLVLQKVKEDIINKKKGVMRVVRGKAPHLLSGILHRYYKKHRKTKAFYANEACVGCGLCEQICPLDTITLKEQRPTWGKECTQCLACINRCPVKAIQYGKKTEKRRRYVHPDLLDK